MNQLEKLKRTTHIYETLMSRHDICIRDFIDSIDTEDDLGVGPAPPGYSYGSREHFFLCIQYLDGFVIRSMAAKLGIEAYPKRWDKSFSAKAFISYKSNRKDLAMSISESLQGCNVESFVSDMSLQVGDVFNDEILKNLKKADFFISIHTDGFSKSVYCQQEVGGAIALEIQTISIIVDEKPLGFIDKYQAIDGTQRIDNIIEDVCKALQNSKKTKKLYNKKMARYIYDPTRDYYYDETTKPVQDKEKMKEFHNKVLDKFFQNQAQAREEAGIKIAESGSIFKKSKIITWLKKHLPKN